MARGISVRVPDLGELKKFVTEKDMRAAGEMLLARQHSRITGGINSKGRLMKPLSKDYAKEVGRSVRTLSLTGLMMASRQVVQATATKVRLGFVGAPTYVYVQEAKSKFLKATEKEREAVFAFLTKRLSARIKTNVERIRKVDV